MENFIFCAENLGSLWDDKKIFKGKTYIKQSIQSYKIPETQKKKLILSLVLGKLTGLKKA